MLLLPKSESFPHLMHKGICLGVVSGREDDTIRFLTFSSVLFLYASVFQFSSCTQLCAKLTNQLKHLLIRISLGKETQW